MEHSFIKKLEGTLRAVFCGVLTGTFTAAVIVLYKICAGAAIDISHRGYVYLLKHLFWIPAVLAVLYVIAVLVALVYRKYPYMKGGGIPTSIGILRGFIEFHWLKNLVGTFFLSLTTFVVGVPLGNEGPSVQMGTAIGRGSARAFQKSRSVLDRYSMTGGACAGFSSATGAPISGIMFAVEEAHGQFSPLVLLVSAVSVLSSRAVMELLCPLFGVSVALFPDLQLTRLPAYSLWLPMLVGVAVGLFSVLFLKYYRIIHRLLHRFMHKCRLDVLIFAVFCLTLIAGLCSFSFVSTGHELILKMLTGTHLLPLLVILLVRTTLTLSANSVGITGGVFVPVLTIGALASAFFGTVLVNAFGLSSEYSTLILVLGITSCIAGTMKMPLTAIVFAVEALSCYGNLLSVITAAVTAFAITELFGAHSINEHVLERKLKGLNRDKIAEVYDTFVTVKPNSFVVGKQIRDVLWPANLFILSIRHEGENSAEVGELGGKALSVGDLLHVRYSTFSETETKEQLIALVGEQSYAETQTDII